MLFKAQSMTVLSHPHEDSPHADSSLVPCDGARAATLEALPLVLWLLLPPVHGGLTLGACASFPLPPSAPSPWLPGWLLGAVV